jgi:hypothetical protein
LRNVIPRSCFFEHLLFGEPVHTLGSILEKMLLPETL